MLNICSLIVDAQPDRREALERELATWDGVELHAATPEGRLVVTVESASDADTTDTLHRLGACPGVMSVALVYHHFEPDSEAAHGTEPS
ncbi:MAG: chaperone NapD [Rubrivivax sp.]